MFEASQLNYTVALVIGGIVALITLIFVIASVVSKSSTAGILTFVAAFMGLFIALGAAGIMEKMTYQDNVQLLEKHFENQYSGDFSFTPGNWSINMYSFAHVEDQRITVERKLDNAIYLYRLTAGEDETQPALMEIVSGDRSDYPPLQK